MKKCIVCRKELEKDEEDICRTCQEILETKYPDKNKYKEVLEWHKKYLKEKR